MQFMMGTYCPLASGVTERTTIRGFAFRAGPVAAEDVEPKERSEVLERRLISAKKRESVSTGGCKEEERAYGTAPWTMPRRD